MSDPATFNVQAFQPYDGGMGKRLSAGTTTTSAAIPGTQTDDRGRLRVLIVNGGTVSAFVRMGQSGVTATLDCLEVLPGCAYLLTPPGTNPSGVWLAAITEAGSANIQVTAGQGT